MFKRVVVWDLDETLIDSSHRVPNHPDGTLNLEKYFELKTDENVMRDSLLPLAEVFKAMNREENYIVICTARCMTTVDRQFLKVHNLFAHKILCRPKDGSENRIKDAVLKRRKIQTLRNLRQFREKEWIMFDDAIPVIREMRKIGIVCLNAVKVNKRLAKV